jgi:glycosyltransferase involved in cell wall biosynthesis
MDRIRLLKFVTVFAIGGTERHVVNLARGLDPSRFELHLACFRRRGALLNEVDLNRVPLSEYNITHFYNYGALRKGMKLARYIRRNRIEIVHSYNFYSNVFAIPAAVLAGTPVIVASVRDTGLYTTPLKGLVHRSVCRLAHRIVVNAEAIRRWLVSEGCPPDKVTVIRNGIDLARFSDRNSGAGLRRELGIPPGARLVVVLSRLDRLKGIEYFLEAAFFLAGRFKDAYFLIVGDDATVRKGRIAEGVVYRRELEAYAARLGLDRRVVFTGFRLDVPALLSEASVSVLPSLSEGLSNTLLESMAAGVPVVATRVGGSPEAIEDGVAGLLVPPRDSGALAEAIGLLLDHPGIASRIGRAGREWVSKHCSLDGMVRETEDLYHALLEKTRRRPV